MDIFRDLKPKTLGKIQKLEILESDFEVNFVRGTGKGGQKQNKTSSCAFVKHLPTGLFVKCQRYRIKEANLKTAMRLLVDKIEEKKLGKKSEKQLKFEKIRKNKKRRESKTKNKLENMQNSKLFMILSPSKTQNFEQSCPQVFHNLCAKPTFFEETTQLLSVLKDKDVPEIANLMSVSDKIAILNFQRFQDFSLDYKQRSLPAILAFKGDVYKHIDAINYNQEDLNFANDRLGIISGFYGLLKPCDLIQPYRLEMKTKLENAYGKDLYKFWGQKITNYLNQNLSEYDFVINLASNEYSKAIDRKKLKAKVIDIDFKHKKGDKVSTIAIYAKLARGLFADYIIKNKIDTVDKLRKIVLNNYNLDLEKSNDYNLVFVKDVTIK